MTPKIGGTSAASFFFSPFFIVVAAYLSLGVIYSASTPVFENGDEQYHFQYALDLANGKGLPITGVGDLGQVAAHPPLYYVLGSFLLRWADTRDLNSYFRLNPHAQLTRFDQPDNKNRFIHTTQEAIPYQGTALAVQFLRYLSLGFGVITVVFTGLMVQQIMPDRGGALWVAMSVAAFLPQFLVVSTAARNDSAIIALSAMGLWFLCRALQRPLALLQTFTLGVVCGLAALAKTSGLMLSAFIIGFIVVDRWIKVGAKEGLRIALQLSLPVLVIAGWWYIRNVMLYGDPLGTQAMLAITGARGFSTWQVITSSEPFLWSWWATAGWFNIALPPFVYWVLDVVAIVLLLGAARLALRLWQARARKRALLLSLLGLWGLLTYGAVVIWAQQAPLGYDGRLAFPALPAFAVLCAVGWAYWVPVRFERVLGGPLLILWGALALAFPLFVIGPAFARPPILAENNLPAQLIPVTQNYAGEVELMGLTLTPKNVHPGDPLTVTLYWKALAKPTRPYSVVLSLLGRDEQVLAHSDSYPGGGNYPTDLWEAGQIVADDYQFQVAEDAVGPTRVKVFLGLHLFETDINLDPPPAVLPVESGLSVIPAQPENFANQPSAALFEGQVALVRYTVSPATVAPGGSLTITLDWAGLKPLTEDFTVFTHLVDARGQIIGQMDRQPANGDWPTSLWVPNQVWRDPYTLTVDPTALAGPAHLELGLYRLADGSRLLLDTGGDTFVPNTSVQIQP